MKKEIKILLLLLVLITSCTKYTINDIKVIPWETDIAFPLINSTFYVSDVFDLNDSTKLVYIDEENGLLGIVYSGTIFSYDASDIVEVGDQVLTKNIQYLDPGLPVSVTDTVYYSEVFTLDFENQSVEGVEAVYLSMLSGTLELEISSDIAYLTNVQLQIPEMKKDGIAYEFESDVAPGNSVSESEDLEGYLMDLSQEDLNYNQLRINYRLIIEYDPSTPSTGEDLDILFHFNQPKLDYIIGYFGQNSLASKIDTIKIELFNNTVDGHFQFIDPYMYVNFNNSFGFPTLIDITDFRSVNQTTGEETPLYLEGLTDAPFEITYPTQLGDSAIDEYYFDNSNSNIEVILNEGDKYVIWGLDASSNPNGPEQTFNFLTHESKLEVKTEITVPLKGYAWDWIFSDTTRVDSGSTEVEDVDEVLEITLRLILDNGFPAEGIVQIYTTDSAFQITDSLFDVPTQILESGILVDGIITESTKTITDIVITEDKKDNILNAKNFITVAKMQTTNGSDEEVIQIYDYYSIGIKMGIKAKLLVDPESL